MTMFNLFLVLFFLFTPYGNTQISVSEAGIEISSHKINMVSDVYSKHLIETNIQDSLK